MTPVARACVSTALAFALVLPPVSSWFGADKVKHFLMSAFVQSTAFSLTRAAGADRAASNVAGAAASAAVAVGRELHDRRIGKPFSAQDLVWDAAGAGAMAALLARSR